MQNHDLSFILRLQFREYNYSEYPSGINLIFSEYLCYFNKYDHINVYYRRLLMKV